MTSNRPIRWGAAFVMITAVAMMAFTQSATTLPADINAESRARLPYMQRQNLDEAGQKIFDTLPQAVVRGPLAYAAYNPRVAKALMDLHDAAIAGSLTPHVRELAILVACR